jgi:hypothetical protein
MIYQLTARIPVLMQQSHLESKQGQLVLSILIECGFDIACSLGSLLVTDIPGPYDAMHQPLSRDQAPSIFISTALSVIRRTDLRKSRGMDCDFRRGLISADNSFAEARSVLLGSRWHE